MSRRTRNDSSLFAAVAYAAALDSAMRRVSIKPDPRRSRCATTEHCQRHAQSSQRKLKIKQSIAQRPSSGRDPHMNAKCIGVYVADEVLYIYDEFVKRV